MSKHSRDLLHHAEARGSSELKEIAQKAFDISTKMLGVKEKKLYSDIRDLEHHSEDLLTALRTERKKLQWKENNEKCTTCERLEESVERLKTAKTLNRDSDKISNSVQDKEIAMVNEIIKALGGSFVGKGVSIVTPRFVTGSTFGVQNKTLVNLGLGIGICALALLKPGTLRKFEMPAVIAASFLIASEVGDMAAQYIPAGIPAGYAPAPSPAAPAGYVPTNSVSMGVAQFANGKHIFVD